MTTPIQTTVEHVVFTDLLTDKRLSVPPDRIVQIVDGNAWRTVILQGPPDRIFAVESHAELLARLRAARTGSPSRADDDDDSTSHAQSGAVRESRTAADPVDQAWHENLAGVRDEFRGDEKCYRAFVAAKRGGRASIIAGPPQTPPPIAQASETEEQLRSRFAHDPALRAEFDGDERTFLAFARAEREGRVGSIVQRPG